MLCDSKHVTAYHERFGPANVTPRLCYGACYGYFRAPPLYRHAVAAEYMPLISPCAPKGLSILAALAPRLPQGSVLQFFGRAVANRQPRRATQRRRARCRVRGFERAPDYPYDRPRLTAGDPYATTKSAGDARRRRELRHERQVRDGRLRRARARRAARRLDEFLRRPRRRVRRAHVDDDRRFFI